MRLPNAGRIYPSYVYAGLPKKSPFRQKRRICLRQIHANRPIRAGFRPNAAPAQRGSRLFRQAQGKSALPCVFNGGFSERNFSRQRKVFWGQIAQSVEQRTENPRVGSSNLSLAKTKSFAAIWRQSRRMAAKRQLAAHNQNRDQSAFFLPQYAGFSVYWCR